MMEVLRFLLFLLTTVVLVKVGENVLLNWKKDSVKDIVPEDENGKFEEGDAKPDDLTLIEGIKPGMIQILNEAGFYTFSDVELADVVDLKRTIETSFPHVTETELKLWVRQASLAEQDRWDELDKVKEAMRKARSKPKIQ